MNDDPKLLTVEIVATEISVDDVIGVAAPYCVRSAKSPLLVIVVTLSSDREVREPTESDDEPSVIVEALRNERPVSDAADREADPSERVEESTMAELKRDRDVNEPFSIEKVPSVNVADRRRVACAVVALICESVVKDPVSNDAEPSVSVKLRENVALKRANEESVEDDNVAEPSVNVAT